MRAVVISGPNEIRVKDVPNPIPKPDEVIVKVGAVGICGTDLAIVAGNFPPTIFPVIPGHEFAGEVVARGSSVDFFSAGDRVAVDPSLLCRHCEWCHIGRDNLCDNWGVIGGTINGASADFVAVPARNCHTLPGHLSYCQGALVEPLSCAVHAVRTLSTQIGESALVVGAGTMGLLTTQLINLAGASTVAVVDRNEKRLKLARELGATIVDNDICRLAEQAGCFDIVVDASGSAAAMQTSLDAVRKGGRFMLVGVAPPRARISISPFRINDEEITILGSRGVLDSFDLALRLIADGTVLVDPLIATALPIEDYSVALGAVGKSESVKIQIVP